MTHTDTAPDASPRHARRIPPPSPTREPMKVNIFDFATVATCQLLPLFPYFDAGAMVPCCAVISGDPDDSEFGMFFHYNTAQEVAVNFGASNAMLQSGQIFVTQQLHGVNSFLRDPADPTAFIVMTITQHQAEEGDQREAIIFRCRECNEELHRHDYNAAPKGADGFDPSQWGGTADDDVTPFVTLWGSDKAAVDYNDEVVRTCPKCHHVNPEHPHHKWGWNHYVSQVRAAESAKRAFQSASLPASKES